MRYAIVSEKVEGNYSACVPDLPGCVSTGATVEETEKSIREAITFHLNGVREDRTPISSHLRAMSNMSRLLLNPVLHERPQASVAEHGVRPRRVRK